MMFQPHHHWHYHHRHHHALPRLQQQQYYVHASLLLPSLLQDHVLLQPFKLLLQLLLQEGPIRPR